MKKRKASLSLLMLTACVSPFSVQAENAIATPQQLKEVVITTTRIPELKTNAAATVTVIDQKQIAEMSKIAPDLSHLLGLVTPGMALASNTTSSRTQSLRGRSALILIDGIPRYEND